MAPADPRTDQRHRRRHPLDLLEAIETLEREHPQFVEPVPAARRLPDLPYGDRAAVDPPGTIKAEIDHGRQLVRPMLAESPRGARAIRALLLLAGLAVGCDDNDGTTASAKPRPTTATASGSASLPTETDAPPDPDDPELDPALSEPVEAPVYPDIGDPSVDSCTTTSTWPGRPTPARWSATRRSSSARPAPATTWARPRRAARRLGGHARRCRRAVRAPGQGPRGQRAARRTAALDVHYSGTPETTPAPTKRSDFDSSGWAITPVVRPGRCSRTARYVVPRQRPAVRQGVATTSPSRSLRPGSVSRTGADRPDRARRTRPRRSGTCRSRRRRTS